MRRARARPRREEGVSNVLGAILVFGLLIVTLVTIQVRFVPVWEQDKEAAHMQEVLDQMRQLQADLDRQAGNDTSGPLTDPLTLRKEGGFRFFQGASQANAQLTFQPAPAGTGISVFTCAAAGPGCAVHVVRRGGQTLFGLTDVWTDFTSSQISNVQQVQNLRVRVDLTPTAAYTNGQSATLRIFGAASAVNPIGQVVFTYQEFPSENALKIAILDANGNEVSSDLEAFFQQTVIDWQYFDLLAPALLLPQILASAQPPYRFDLVPNGLQAQYQVAYIDSNQAPIGGAGGVPLTFYSTTVASGHLALTASNPYFVDQTYTLEHGGVVLAQGTGAGLGSTLLSPPAFQVSASNTVLGLALTVPGLVGTGSNRGEASASVVATPLGGADEVWVTAPRLTIVFPTAYGSAWCAYFDGLLSGAGLSSLGGTPQYTVAATSAQCSLTIFGPTTGPTSSTEDLFLRLRTSPIDLTTSILG